MREAPEKDDEIDLDLPALDGSDEAATDEPEYEGLDLTEAGGDAFDDATGEDDPAPELAVEGSESGWLVDTDDAAGAVDVGAFDVVLEPEGKVLDDHEPESVAAAFDDFVAGDETIVA
ncbi:MAG TPA: hypothetical protein VM580_19295, partial [Labilithrix sp.]|nr:hypothetical protein [Labilithrix sp.]